MSRNRYILCMMLTIALFLTGCGTSNLPARVFHNGYLGLTVTAAPGWTIECNEGNMTRSPEESQSYESLQIEENGNILYMGLAYMEYKDIYIDIFAENGANTYKDMEQYIQACIEAYSSDSGFGEPNEFVSRDTQTVDNSSYERLVFTYTGIGGEELWQEYYIRAIGNWYFTAFLQYDASNEQTAQHTLRTSFHIQPESPAQQEPSVAPLELYNSYLGITVRVPEQAVALSWDENNLSTDELATGDVNALSWQEYEEGILYMELIEFSNGVNEDLPEYSSCSLAAEAYQTPMTLEEYVNSYIEVYGQYEEEGGVLTRDKAILAGKEFERVVFRAYWGNYDTVEVYVCEVKGVFFVATSTYWSDNEQSRQDASKILNECFEFSLPSMIQI